jgi:alpha-D-ribose 1-methylphosphonate 5-triphosphate synthase subunit PhnG
MIDLDALDALEAKATPGPWWSEIYSVENSHATICNCADVMVDYPADHASSNAELIAELRNSYRAMAAELRAARAVVEEAKSHVDAAFILQTVLNEYDEVTNG